MNVNYILPFLLPCSRPLLPHGTLFTRNHYPERAPALPGWSDAIGKILASYPMLAIGASLLHLEVGANLLVVGALALGNPLLKPFLGELNVRMPPMGASSIRAPVVPEIYASVTVHVQTS